MGKRVARRRSNVASSTAFGGDTVAPVPSELPIAALTLESFSGPLAQIQFYLNRKPICLTQVAPTQTVLQYLREDAHLCGTKEGCAEGDCGACTVLIGDVETAASGATKARNLRTVNACIQFVPTLHGKALYTVEALGGNHPAQLALVDCHGSQCGFCTPGFVMSLCQLYHETTTNAISEAEVRSALTGNLCRCTGYKPIIAAGLSMRRYPRTEFDLTLNAPDQSPAPRGEPPSVTTLEAPAAFFSPNTLAELHLLKATHHKATVLAGGTDVGLWVNKQFHDLGHVIYIGNVAGLGKITEHLSHLEIGATATLAATYTALAPHYPQMTQMWERFASPPIRHAGTIGGNIANGSPIGDSMPALIALGATVRVSSLRGSHSMPLEDLYRSYQVKNLEADEIIEAVMVPLLTSEAKKAFRYRVYKISKRFDSDISAVCMAIAMTVERGVIMQVRIGMGGMSGVPQRAPNLELALLMHAFKPETFETAKAALALDFQPLSDLRASAGYRLKVAQNLLMRFFLEGENLYDELNLDVANFQL
jgi:xanthine dehydrogenase small subunit